MKTFTEYADDRGFIDAGQHLAEHLINSGVEVEKFNEALLILEWGYNPLKTFGQSGAASAGAVMGSAFGPMGTAAGGLVGAGLGKLGSHLAGKYMQGSQVKTIQPAYHQAIQAVDNLNKMLGNSPLSQEISKIKQNLGTLKEPIDKIDQTNNNNLDRKLQAGGGWGAKLRGAQGDSWFSNMQRNIGEKIKNIPILNKDMGLRRALSQGMDSLQQWAQQNPKKAAALNIGAGIGGAFAGAAGAGMVKNNAFSGQPQQQEPQHNNTEVPGRRFPDGRTYQQVFHPTPGSPGHEADAFVPQGSKNYQWSGDGSSDQGQAIQRDLNYRQQHSQDFFNRLRNKTRS